MNTVTILETDSLLIICVNITPSTEKIFFVCSLYLQTLDLNLVRYAQ